VLDETNKAAAQHPDAEYDTAFLANERVQVFQKAERSCDDPSTVILGTSSPLFDACAPLAMVIVFTYRYLR
jgi:hypothetical protein